MTFFFFLNRKRTSGASAVPTSCELPPPWESDPYPFLLSSGGQVSLTAGQARSPLLYLWGSKTNIIKFVFLLLISYASQTIILAKEHRREEGRVFAPYRDTRFLLCVTVDPMAQTTPVSPTTGWRARTSGTSSSQVQRPGVPAQGAGLTRLR